MTSTHDAVFVRPAWTDEGPALSELALEAKAHWGYDAEFMARCRDELTITSRKIAKFRIRVAEINGERAGFSAMGVVERMADVEDLFVAPRFMGVGVGHCLMQDMLDHARRHGIQFVQVEADPNATGFYEREGFRMCGQVPSGSIPGRKLPLMELSF
jgi:N-acetylglutamate synthase-like GNAT family acetyltransferase